MKLPLKEPVKSRSPVPRKFLLLGAVGFLLVIIAVIYFYWTENEPTTADQPQKKAVPVGSIFDPPPASQPATREAALPGSSGGQAAIKTIRLTPAQPTRLDTLQATVVPLDTGKDLAYTYRWKVNDRIVEGAEGNSLSLTNYKKRDLITVTVTPYEGDKPGFPVESPVIALYSIPPTLDLKPPQEKKKKGQSIELQLISQHPDHDSVTFGLTSPLVSGMSLDSRTGKITWMIQPEQKGKIPFGAFVEDPDGTKVTKTFELMIN